MKLSKITLACLLATSGLSVSSTVSAEITQDFEFGGYFRTGLLFSAENDFKESEFIGQKETLGRLGIESDDDASINFASTWSFDNGNAVRISAGFDEDAEIGVGVELTGVTPSGILWGGDRGHGKDNYIFMTDFFYTDMSGTGVGIDGFEVGDLLIDVAYIASNRDDDDYNPDDSSYANNENLDNYMHTINMALTYNSYEISVSGKVMPDNWDEAGNGYAETGADVTLIYTLDDFFWTGSGQGAIIAQAGIGLGSGNLLGGTINDYNAYHPGSAAQGEHSSGTNDWGIAGDARRNLTYVHKDDTSARLLIWGGYNFDNGISIFPSIQGQYNNHEDGKGYDYWTSAMVRPYFPVNDFMFVQTEFGVVYNNWNGGSWIQQKATIAPTFIIGTGKVTPEIRFFASYVKNAWTVDDGDDVIVGLQTEVNW